MSPKKDSENEDEEEQQTPQQKIESWLKRMGDSNAELDIGPGMV